MREIKFRGKRTDNGEWVYGNFIADALEQVGRNDTPWGFIKYYDKSMGKGVTYEVGRETVGQYVGMKDKNGKEIYEGDIVELVNTYRGMNQRSVVQIAFCDYTFAGKRDCEDMPSGYIYNPLGSYNLLVVTIEVIGNIFDNADLLKAGEKS